MQRPKTKPINKTMATKMNIRVISIEPINVIRSVRCCSVREKPSVALAVDKAPSNAFSIAINS